MGHLLYGSTPTVIDLDDRTLAHVELVTLAKLRRNESFALTLDGATGGRSTIWLNSSSTIEFRFDTAKNEINREWLDLLSQSASTVTGLLRIPEPLKQL